MTPCPCGGEPYVDEFKWPKRDRVYFLRCKSCGGMSDTVKTPEEAESLLIHYEQNGELK